MTLYIGDIKHTCFFLLLYNDAARCFCLAYQHGFPNHFKNNLGGKVSRRRIRAYIVLYMWGEYFIDILAHKVGKNTNIGHFGYVQFANYGNQCLTVKS